MNTQDKLIDVKDLSLVTSAVMTNIYDIQNDSEAMRNDISDLNYHVDDLYEQIGNLPSPMVFKGSLGTGGTITSLPTAAATNEGYTYKVITAGTYASQTAKIGDLFICAKTGNNTYAWTGVPSGDEPSGTVTSITLKATSPIAIDSSSAITTSGTRTLSHANSGVTAGTYRSVTVNATGHVTAGTNPTTLSGYGITDAKIASGTITLGSNSITPLTSHQDISGKVNVASIDITGQSTTLLALTKALATNQINYARGYSTTDGGTSGISDKPTGTTNAGFVCEAYCNRYASSSDYRYVLICWVQGDTNPYITAVSTSTTTISWSRLNTNTTYTAGTGLTLSGTQFKHTNNVTAATAGTSSATSGSTLAVPYVTYDAQGHITASGTHTHTITGFATSDTKNTAGSTDTSSKIFLIGATSQAANPQTYSDNEVYATSGVLTTKSVQVGGTAATMQYNSTDKCIEFIFA